MRRNRTFLGLAAASLALTGCVDLTTTLNVAPGSATPLVLDGSSGPVTIPAGAHPAQLSIAQSGRDKSELALTDLNRKFPLSLPDAQKMLSIVDPLVLTPEQVGQPVSMTLTRAPDYATDHYTITFSTPDGGSTLASADFDYKSDSVAYDASDKSFLLSFQEVRRSQRGAMVTIDGGMAEPMNGILDFSAQALLAPWLYARYSDVQWQLGHVPDDQRRASWSDLIASSPEVDYFGFNHGGYDIAMLQESDGLPWKKSQLRLVYTEGCGSASSDYFEDFLGKYGAAVAIGHRDLSASPVWAFFLVHAWTYGETAKVAASSAREWGDALAWVANGMTFGFLSSMDWRNEADMVKGSEFGLAWTPEMPPEKLDIDTSAVLRRDTPAEQVVSLSFIDSYGSQVEHPSILGSNAAPSDPLN